MVFLASAAPRSAGRWRARPPSGRKAGRQRSASPPSTDEVGEHIQLAELVPRFCDGGRVISPLWPEMWEPTPHPDLLWSFPAGRKEKEPPILRETFHPE